MRSTTYSRLLLALVVLYTAAALTYWVTGVRDQASVDTHPEQHAAEPIGFDPDTRVISYVRQEAEAAGVRVGQTLQTLNGAAYSGLAQWEDVVNSSAPGEPLEIGFLRQDGTAGSAKFTLQKSPGRNDGGSTIGFLIRIGILNFTMPLVCLLVGIWVAAARPTDANAWLLLILLTFPEVAFIGQEQAVGGWLIFRGGWQEVLLILTPFALLLFGVYFPERSRLDVRAPWLKWVVLLPLALSGAEHFLDWTRQNFVGHASPLALRASHLSESAGNSLGLISVLLYLFLIIDKLRTASTEDARRRLRVLSVGTGVGMGALLVVFVLLPRIGFVPNARGHLWAAYLGMTFFLMAPLSLGYVVVVQRALDVRILVRNGTRYALARVTLWVVQAALIVVIARRTFAPMLEHRAPEPFDLLMLALFVTLVLALRFGGRKRLQAWLDRKFFREAYDSERILSELSEEARKFTETQPLLQMVAQRVSETLHISKIGMLMNGSGGFYLHQAVGMPTDGQLVLRSGSSAIRNLSITNTPARLYREDPDAWYLMADDLERDSLDAMQTELLLPLSGRNRMMGVMSLGPKKSEAAYSRSDLHLLQMVAVQTGLALEVSELAISLANEAAQRERAMKEMEIAREVQERLFPQEMPVLHGATVAGACRPAMGVGGDYYDVFCLPDGRLGLAIGDVSGKGISAALLMASLRASLRGVTMDSPRDFARLMHKVNRLVYEASASNRYATFFFAAFDPKTCLLDCVNAGHNPPLVLRCTPDGKTETILIEADGPVVGLLPDAPYTEQSLQLQPGDLLLAYTDGISEAMTRRDEEWGEERMMAAASEVLDAPADEVLHRVFAAVDKFTAGAPQHDDMTLLILKLSKVAS